MQSPGCAVHFGTPFFTLTEASLICHTYHAVAHKVRLSVPSVIQFKAGCLKVEGFTSMPARIDTYPCCEVY